MRLHISLFVTFGVAVHLRSTNESCGNNEETTLCHYRIGSLTVDAVGTLQSDSGRGALSTLRYT